MSDAGDLECLREYVRTGCGRAFERIVRRHARMVYAAALRTVHDPDAAEDVAQTVFSILGRKARLLVEREAVISAWLATTARFTAIDTRRRMLRRREHERRAAGLKRERDGGSDGSVNELKDLRVVEEAVARLKPKDRQVIVKRYFENQGIAELARDFGCTEEALRQRLGRAVEKLRKVLGGAQMAH